MRSTAPAIVRTELRRKYRAIRDDGTQFVASLLGGLFIVLLLFAVVVGAFFAGQFVAGTDLATLPFAPLRLARTGAAGLTAMVAAVTALRTVQQSGIPEHPDGILTIVRHRDAVAGLLGTEAVFLLAGVALPGVLASATFGIGAAVPVTATLLAVSVVSLTALGTVGGFAIGLAIKVAVARVELLARFKTAIGAAVFLAYMAVVYSQRAQSAAEPALNAIAASPLGWFADLAGLAFLPAASPLRAGGAVVTVLAGVPLLFGLASRLAAERWYTEPVRPETESVSSGMSSTGLVARSTERIVRKTWLRARRSPLRLVFVAYPLFVFVGPAMEALETGIPASFAPTVALYGAWATGAAFTLNPFGDEGPVLPVTLTAPVSGRRFVGALCLAGLVVGLPLTVAAAVGTALLAGGDLSTTVAAGTLAVVACLAAPAVAAGVGVSFPRLEPVQNRGRELMIPSIFGFAVYSVVLGLALAPGLVVTYPAAAALLAGVLSVPVSVVLGVGVGVSAVLLGAAGGVGFRHAAAAFDDYTLA